MSLRQTRPTTTSESTLHLLLNLARSDDRRDVEGREEAWDVLLTCPLCCFFRSRRLNSLSHLESEMSSAERWQEVTQLFEQVHQRNTA